MYKKIFVGLMASFMPFAISEAATGPMLPANQPAVQAAAAASSQAEQPLATVITKSKEKDIVTVSDPAYASLFAAPSAKDGVRKIIAEGNFRINGFAIPADAKTFAEKWPQGYTVNGSVWLSQKDGSYIVDKKTYTDYADAALALVQRIPAGLELKIYDKDGDGKGDAIDATVWEAVIPHTLKKDKDGNIIVHRLEQTDYPAALPGEGRAYDASRFTTDSDEKIAPQNLDPSIHPDDMALFAYMPSGWTLQRAIPVTGPLESAMDHRYYQLNGIRYHDAMRFSRDNLPISNRCGEFINTLKYFKEMHRANSPAITLWLVPTSSGQPGAPAGFTSGANASLLLKDALKQSRQKMAQVFISEDGSDVPSGKTWMTKKAYQQAQETIKTAQKVYDQHKDGVLMDYERYLLYLALNGGQDDIGAAYAGYDFEGIHTNENK